MNSNLVFNPASIEGAQRLSKYGHVLRDLSAAGGEVFREENMKGWRIAEITVLKPVLDSMSFHSNTPEAFFPLDNKNVILTLSLDDSFKEVDSFFISEPIVINSKIWHGLSSAETARLLVAENADVLLETKSI